ncbi:endonuclease III [Aerococcus urinaehominis]|uniref:Endonuclease III n=1 Tax=Aerococcus urinaehominis TaxID=128944 RepID=A0A120IAW0_9LACT|nr:endonuclease III [Aerococcus urinaehominis]AMB99250.1 endonuclease III [Aerococcus urinaehominis]SDM31057.1 DNA-(apurinic or apyrimidinic site) lyase /endonuclease III [Aerococcus urinaehominis]
MLSDKNARYILDEIIKFYPNVQTELIHHNNFELLIAVILSAQTTDQGVNQVTPALFSDFPTAQALAAANPKDLVPYLYSIGLYQNKAKYIQATAQKLLTDFDGQVPTQRDQLESLPGVGRKTANVVLSLAFDQPAFGVDTHVARVAKRHGIVDAGANNQTIEDRITSLLAPQHWRQAHQAMVRFGRYICTAKHPKCHCYPHLFELPDGEDTQALINHP